LVFLWFSIINCSGDSSVLSKNNFIFVRRPVVTPVATHGIKGGLVDDYWNGMER